MSGFDLLTAHFVGDVLAQNDWQASGKKRSSLICALHCLIWTTAIVLFNFWGLTPVQAAVGVVWLFGTHFAIDRWGFPRWYMAKMGQDVFATPPSVQFDDSVGLNHCWRYKVGLGPWSIIWVDQVMHLLTLWLLAKAVNGGWI